MLAQSTKGEEACTIGCVETVMGAYELNWLKSAAMTVDME